jgi:hypothetical protein
MHLSSVYVLPHFFRSEPQNSIKTRTKLLQMPIQKATKARTTIYLIPSCHLGKESILEAWSLNDL